MAHHDRESFAGFDQMHPNAVGIYESMTKLGHLYFPSTPLHLGRGCATALRAPFGTGAKCLSIFRRFPYSPMKIFQQASIMRNSRTARQSTSFLVCSPIL